jgi:hypothetical protein
MFASNENTTLVLLPHGELQRRVIAAAKQTNVHLCFATCETDLIAIPAFLAIVDPALLTAAEWTSLCEAYSEMQDQNMKFLLVSPSPHCAKLPAFNRVKAPEKLDETYFKFLMLRTRATIARRMAAFRRPEKRIIRMMYMLQKLENEPPLRLQDVAQEFGASVRTIQRDMQVLLMAGHPIVGPDGNGGYHIPENYKAYSIYPLRGEND